MSDAPLIATRVEGSVGWLVFDRPDKLNAMSRDMWQTLPDALASLVATDGLRVIVLTGADERAFVAGADIKEFELMRSSQSAVEAYNAASHSAFAAIADCRLPTIASIRGVCLGGGLAIAACCDLRYAADSAVFSIPAVRLGLGYPMDSLRRIYDLVGPAHAREVFFTGRRYDAAEAARLGLINRALPEPELAGHVVEIAEAIAAGAPLTIAAFKLGLNALALEPDERDLAACEAAVARCFASRDYAEGRQAFVEKRAPEFRGE